MGFLQRSAVNVAVILPLLGIAGCISYVISKRLGSSEPSLESPPTVARATLPAAKAVTVIDAERVRQPTEIAAEALGRCPFASRCDGRTSPGSDLTDPPAQAATEKAWAFARSTLSFSADPVCSVRS
jgi:hypothetical protein